VSPSRSRCQSFLIDQTGLIQFHLVHRIEERAMDALVQLILNISGCGRLHFTSGPLTLHFDRDEFLVFARVVATLAAQLGRIEDSRHPALGQGERLLLRGKHGGGTC
jgi:hypothetical protein